MHTLNTMWLRQHNPEHCIKDAVNNKRVYFVRTNLYVYSKEETLSLFFWTKKKETLSGSRPKLWNSVFGDATWASFKRFGPSFFFIFLFWAVFGPMLGLDESSVSVHIMYNSWRPVQNIQPPSRLGSPSSTFASRKAQQGQRVNFYFLLIVSVSFIRVFSWRNARCVA